MAYRDSSYDRPLDNPINWSFRVGRLFAIDLRVHVAFVLCAVLLVWMEIPEKGTETDWSLVEVLGRSLGTYAILFAIVLLHEFGHCFGARRTGGEADQILMWPLGGLASVNPPHTARAHMVTTVAGPMVNVMICAVCSIALVLWFGSLGAVPWNPLHPFTPVRLTSFPTSGQIWLLRFYGLSYFLLLVNLLPVFPFDGGRIVQAWLWPTKGYRRSMEIATGTGMIGAILIGLFALIFGRIDGNGWLILMIAVFGYVTCYQTRRALREHGDLAGAGLGGLSGGYEFLADRDDEQRKPGYFERRRLRRAALKAEMERKKRRAHERAVERVLRKVSESGLASLTSRERRILEEETHRQRMG